jgi:hypothetical protein
MYRLGVINNGTLFRDIQTWSSFLWLRTADSFYYMQVQKMQALKNTVAAVFG